MSFKNILCLFLSIAINSFGQQRVALVEEFSSSTCPPCKTFNDKVFVPFLKDGSMAGKYVSISYRMNWPSPGDKYCNEESLSRKTYYNVTGVPTATIDGVADKNSSTLDAFKKKVQDAVAKQAKASLSIVHQITGQSVGDATVAIEATVGSTQDLSEAVLYVALIEKKTTKNVGSNGEKEFHTVFMKFIPDSKGKPLSLKANTPQTFRERASLKGTNIEELSDCEVIGWIQKSNKEVVQAAASKPQSVEIVNASKKATDLKCVTITNAGSRWLTIFDAAEADITVMDLNGRIHARQSSPKNSCSLDLSQLSPGCYIVTVQRGSIYASRSIALIR